MGCVGSKRATLRTSVQALRSRLIDANQLIIIKANPVEECSDAISPLLLTSIHQRAYILLQENRVLLDATAALLKTQDRSMLSAREDLSADVLLPVLTTAVSTHTLAAETFARYAQMHDF